MTRDDLDRLTDIKNAVLAIRSHLSRGSLDDGLVFDAVRVRLIEIGEAVKGLTAAARSVCPDVPWADIAGMRDALAHRYFDTSHSVVEATVDQDLETLLAAVGRIQAEQHGEDRGWPGDRPSPQRSTPPSHPD